MEVSFASGCVDSASITTDTLQKMRPMLDEALACPYFLPNESKCTEILFKNSPKNSCLLRV
ncbi:hypothetical protein EBU02_02510 [bacterium]|nr:hypothetical protein [bacterium]NBS53062.1 hypothetical protein [Spartobacteria bacterium]